MQEDQNTIGMPVKKKSKKTLIIILIVLVVLAIPTCAVVGVVAAIAIPALATARQDAETSIAREVLHTAEFRKTSLLATEGKVAKTWDDISDAFKIEGKKYRSSSELMEYALGGGSLEIEGIDGASETKITLKDGRVVRNLRPNRPVTLGFEEETGRSSYEMPKEVSDAIDAAISSASQIDAILTHTQTIYRRIDWKALADLSSAPSDMVDQLYQNFVDMEDNTQRAVPLVLSLQKDTLGPAHKLGIPDLYQDAVYRNIGMCSTARQYIERYKKTGKMDERLYRLIIEYDKNYARALRALAEGPRSE